MCNYNIAHTGQFMACGLNYYTGDTTNYMSAKCKYSLQEPMVMVPFGFPCHLGAKPCKNDSPKVSWYNYVHEGQNALESTWFAFLFVGI